MKKKNEKEKKHIMGPNDVIASFGPRYVLLAPVGSFAGGVGGGDIGEVVVRVEIWWWWY